MLLGLFRFSSVVSVLAALAAGQTTVPAPDVQDIVQRMVAAKQESRAKIHPITVKRNYVLLDKKADPKAQVVASITYTPPDQQQYQIESSSGGMGERVLKDVLSKDTEPATDTSRKEMTPENYTFRFSREESLDNRRCYVLDVEPRKQEKEMVRGQVWVDAETYLIRRVEGDVVKTPSWWVHDLHITMAYSDVEGMWLRTFTHAVANVRFRGKYVMVSRDVEYRSAPVTTARRTTRNPGILAGAAIGR